MEIAAKMEALRLVLSRKERAGREELESLLLDQIRLTNELLTMLNETIDSVVQIGVEARVEIVALE
jgi:hypothetical protein